MPTRSAALQTWGHDPHRAINVTSMLEMMPCESARSFLDRPVTGRATRLHTPRPPRSARAREGKKRHAGFFGRELAPQHFSDEGLRELGAKHDLNRHFEGSEIRAAVVHELLGRRGGARPQHH